MGDIHGAYKALLQCLHRSGFNYEEDTLIQLGDIVDGYSDVYECVEELTKIPHLIAIKGNHDQWFSEFLQTGIHPQHWEQGGAATASSYWQRMGKTGSGNILDLKSEDIPASHHHFFSAQRLWYIDEHNNGFVHGGFNRLVPFAKQLPHTYYWDRTLWRAALSFDRVAKEKSKSFRMETPFNNIFIGHTPTLQWMMDVPMKAANIYNLDTGAGYYGRLTIMDVHSKEYWQSDPVDTLYEKGGR